MNDSDARLAYMADQIARNFAAQGADAAVSATADHIANFWDPRMRARALELLADDPSMFSAEVQAALALLQPVSSR